jgi:hypothetical protein
LDFIFLHLVFGWFRSWQTTPGYFDFGSVGLSAGCFLRRSVLSTVFLSYFCFGSVAPVVQFRVWGCRIFSLVPVCASLRFWFSAGMVSVQVSSRLHFHLPVRVQRLRSLRA